MAKSDIQLNIGTKYSGEGVVKLEQGLKKANDSAKKATAAVNGITAAIGGMNNAAGKAAQAASGLLESFLQGGIWGAAAAGVMLVINKIVDGFNKAKQASKEAAEFARKQFMTAFESISRNAEIKFSRKISDIEQAQNSSLMQDQIKDAESTMQTMKVRRQYAQKRLDIKSREAEGTYVAQYGSADNDIAVANADEKIAVAEITKSSIHRERDRVMKEYNVEIDKANAESEKTVEKYNKQAQLLNDQLYKLETIEHYNNQIKAAKSRIMTAAINGSAIVDAAANYSLAYSTNKMKSMFGISSTDEADKQLSMLRKNVYGTDDEEKIRRLKANSRFAQAQKKIEDVKRDSYQQYESLNAEFDNADLLFQRSMKDETLKSHLTAEEISSGKLSKFSKNRAKDAVRKEMLSAFEKYNAAQKDAVNMMKDFGLDNTMFQASQKNLEEFIEHLRKQIGKDFGTKGQLADAKFRLLNDKAQNEVLIAKSERQSLLADFMKKSNDDASKSASIETTAKNYSEQEKIKLDEAAKRKDVEYIAQKKAEATKNVEQKKAEVLSYNAKEIQDQLEVAKRNVKESTPAVEDIDIPVRLHYYLKTADDAETNIEELKKKLEAEKDAEVKKNIQVEISEKTTVKSDAEKKLAELKDKLKATENTEKFISNIQHLVKVESKVEGLNKAKAELKDAEDMLKASDAALKTAVESSKPVDDFKFRERIEDKKSSKRIKELTSQLEDLRQQKREKDLIAEDKSKTFAQRRDAKKDSEDIGSKIAKAQMKLSEEWKNSKSSLQNELDTQSKRAEEAKKVLYDDKSTSDQKDEALKQLTDAESKQAKVVQELTSKFNDVKDALNVSTIKELDEQLAKAKGYLANWLQQFRGGGGGGGGQAGGRDGFAEWLKGQRGNKTRAVGTGVFDENGNEVMMDAKAARALDGRKRELDRLQKIKNPTQQTKDKIDYLKKWIDMRDPKKAREKQQEIEALEKQRRLEEMQNNQCMREIRDAIVNGVTL